MVRISRFATVLSMIGISAAAMATPAQNQAMSGTQNSGAPQNKAITIKGCLTGAENRYTIGTSRGDLYVLNGDPSLFTRYNGKIVEATGTMSPATNRTSSQDALSQQPPELKVTKLKKLADVCGN